MAKLKSVAAAGKGTIAVILPDTVSSTRYVEFDAPYLKQAFTAAGLSSSDFIIQNALGKPDAQVSDAQTGHHQRRQRADRRPARLRHRRAHRVAGQAARRGGHRLRPADPGRHPLVLRVSFDNVKVGTVMGQGLTSCVTAWNVKNPQVIVMKGAPTDNNATLFAQGYNAVMAPFFSSNKWTNVSQPGRHLGPADRAV